jgi:organic radical activating enzyme
MDEFQFKLKNIIDLSKTNDLKIFKRKNGKIYLKNFNSIKKQIKSLKEKTINNSYNQIKKDNNTNIIKILNQNLINKLNEIDNLTEDIDYLKSKYSLNNVASYQVNNILDDIDLSEDYIEDYSN